MCFKKKKKKNCQWGLLYWQKRINAVIFQLKDNNLANCHLKRIINMESHSFFYIFKETHKCKYLPTAVQRRK